MTNKEQKMNLTEWTEALRKLKANAPMTIVILPPKTKGLPVGSYNLAILLDYISLAAWMVVEAKL